MLDVLHCVLIDSPEALNMMRDEHIKVIISLFEKHGRDPKVLDVLCSLCFGNDVAVRSSQNNICDYLLPGKNLLLQTQLVDHVARLLLKCLYIYLKTHLKKLYFKYKYFCWTRRDLRNVSEMVFRSNNGLHRTDSAYDATT